MLKVEFGIRARHKYRESFLEIYVHRGMLHLERNLSGRYKSSVTPLFPVAPPKRRFACFFEREFLAEDSADAGRRHSCWDCSRTHLRSYFFCVFDEPSRTLLVWLNGHKKRVELFASAAEKALLGPKTVFIRRLCLGKKSGKGPLQTEEELLETLQRDFSENLDSDCSVQELPSHSRRQSLKSAELEPLSLSESRKSVKRPRRSHSSKSLWRAEPVALPRSVESLNSEDINKLHCELTGSRRMRAPSESWRSLFNQSLTSSPRSHSQKGPVRFRMQQFFTLRHLYFENCALSEREMLGLVLKRGNRSLGFALRQIRGSCEKFSEFLSLAELPKVFAHVAALSGPEQRAFLGDYAQHLLFVNKPFMSTQSELLFLQKHLSTDSDKWAANPRLAKSRFGFDFFIRKMGLGRVINRKAIDQESIRLFCEFENNDKVDLEALLVSAHGSSESGVTFARRVSPVGAATAALKTVFSAIGDISDVRLRTGLLTAVLRQLNRVPFFEKPDELFDLLVHLLLGIVREIPLSRLAFHRTEIAELFKEFVLLLSLKRRPKECPFRGKKRVCYWCTSSPWWCCCAWCRRTGLSSRIFCSPSSGFDSAFSCSGTAAARSPAPRNWSTR